MKKQWIKYSRLFAEVMMVFVVLVLIVSVVEAKRSTPEIDVCVLAKHLTGAVNIGQEKDLSDNESYYVKRELLIVEAYCSHRIVIEADDLPYQLTVDTGEGEGFLPSISTRLNTGKLIIYLDGKNKIDLSGVLDSGDLVSLKNTDHPVNEYFYYDPDTKIGISILTIGGEYKK